MGICRVRHPDDINVNGTGDAINVNRTADDINVKVNRPGDDINVNRTGDDINVNSTRRTSQVARASCTQGLVPYRGESLCVST